MHHRNQGVTACHTKALLLLLAMSQKYLLYGAKALTRPPHNESYANIYKVWILATRPFPLLVVLIDLEHLII